MDFLVLFENVLQLFGGIIAFSIARIAHQGFGKTGSPTLLRIGFAFYLLFAGLFLNGSFELIKIYYPIQHTLFNIIIMGFATLFETAGYFLLALSQFINARSSRHVGHFGIMILPVFSVLSSLKTLSFIFLAYGALETLLSYLKKRNSTTLKISTGFSLLAFGEFIRWLALFESGFSLLQILSILVKLFGFLILYIPVRNFLLYKESIDNVDL